MSAVALKIENFDAVDWLYEPITREDANWYIKQVAFAETKLAELLAKYHLDPEEFKPMGPHPWAVAQGIPEAWYSYLININTTMDEAYAHHFRGWFLPTDPMPLSIEAWPPSVYKRTGGMIGLTFDGQETRSK